MSKVLQGARVAALAAALVAFTAPAASAQFTNGGFESGLTGWTLDGYKLTSPKATMIWNAGGAHSGTNSMRLTQADPVVYGPGYGTYLYQWIPTIAGQSYTLDWWVRGNGDATSFFSAWTSDGGAGWTTLATITGTVSGWTNYQATFTGLAGSTAVGFQSENDIEGYFVDDVSVAAVTATPEPASMVLIGTGLLGVFGVARRRRKA